MSAEAADRGERTAGSAPARSVLPLLLAAAAFHALAYFLLLPPWMGEDEPWQLEVAHHVSRGHMPLGGREYGADAPLHGPMSQIQVMRRFSSVSLEEVAAYQRQVLASMRAHGFWEQVDWAGRDLAPTSFDGVAAGAWGFTSSNQPPLYYLVLGAWLWPVPGDSVLAELYWARALSFLLYLAEVALVFLFARELCADPRVASGAAFFAAWLPLHARHAAVVNNDVLAKVLAAAALWLAARHLRGRASRRELGLGLLFCALALLTKATAAASLVALALAALLRPRATAVLGSARAQRLLVAAAAVALAAIAAWIWAGHHTQVLPRNWRAFEERVTRGLAAENWRSFWETFVGRFNWESRGFSARQYAAALAGAGLLAFGVVRAWLGSTGGADAPPRGAVDRRALAFCAAILLAQLALLVLRGEARGRYALPALPALALLAAVGLLALAPRWRVLTAACGVLALLAYDAFFLWYGLFHNHCVRLGA